jgi:hypothetical protein
MIQGVGHPGQKGWKGDEMSINPGDGKRRGMERQSGKLTIDSIG